MNIRGFEFSFAWLFAIIVGAVIIVLAIFAATNFLSAGKKQVNAQVGAELGVLLNPIETSSESGKYAFIEFPEETKVLTSCSATGTFGQQGISASVKSGVGNQFEQPTTESIFYNKYIFSNSNEQGKRLNLFVKPLELPYKVADLIFASARNYCFVNAPGEINDEVRSLGIENILLVSKVGDCSRNSTIVCFASTGCDVNVNIQTQTVEKGGKTVSYYGPLIYGAIFSDYYTYECQVQRLVKRTSELALLYASKADYLEGKGCGSLLSPELRNYANIAKISSSAQLANVVGTAQDIKNKNDALTCQIF